jgi:hypothetical protein
LTKAKSSHHPAWIKVASSQAQAMLSRLASNALTASRLQQLLLQCSVPSNRYFGSAPDALIDQVGTVPSSSSSFSIFNDESQAKLTPRAVVDRLNRFIIGQVCLSFNTLSVHSLPYELSRQLLEMLQLGTQLASTLMASTLTTQLPAPACSHRTPNTHR